MIETDKPAFAKIVLGFAELKGKQLSLPAVELYWGAMKRWSIDDFKAAAERLLSTSEFMPTPFDFEQMRKAGRPTPGEQFAIVLSYVRSGAYNRDPSLAFLDRDVTRPNAIAERAVRALGGYSVIGLYEFHQIQFLEKRFAEHYEAMQDAQETRDAVPQIARSPATNRLKGPVSAGSLLEELHS